MNERIIELECRIAEQDDQLEALSRRLHEQQGTIDDLTAMVGALQDAIRMLRPSNIAAVEEETPPPHY